MSALKRSSVYGRAIITTWSPQEFFHFYHKGKD